MKYRKKPVVIEATQWFRNGDHPKDNCSLMQRPDPKSGEMYDYPSEGDELSACCKPVLQKLETELAAVTAENRELRAELERAEARAATEAVGWAQSIQECNALKAEIARLREEEESEACKMLNDEANQLESLNKKLRGEIRVLQQRLRDANRGAEKNAWTLYEMALENRKLRYRLIGIGKESAQ